MRIVSCSTLKNFYEQIYYQDSEQPLRSWCHLVRAKDWSSPAEVKADFRNASILQNRRAVFNIAGNKYRLVVSINYSHRMVYVRFIGTHAHYDAIDPQTV